MIFFFRENWGHSAAVSGIILYHTMNPQKNSEKNAAVKGIAKKRLAYTKSISYL